MPSMFQVLQWYVRTEPYSDDICILSSVVVYGAYMQTCKCKCNEWEGIQDNLEAHSRLRKDSLITGCLT